MRRPESDFLKLVSLSLSLSLLSLSLSLLVLLLLLLLFLILICRNPALGNRIFPLSDSLLSIKPQIPVFSTLFSLSLSLSLSAYTYNFTYIYLYVHLFLDPHHSISLFYLWFLLWVWASHLQTTISRKKKKKKNREDLMKMGSIPPELSLDIRPTYVAKTITDFLAELAAIRSASDRLVRIEDFVSRLEEEMRKIDAFKRELPLCMLLLTDAIGTLKEESVKCRARNVEPVLEEFIPLKRKCDRDNDKSEDKKEKMNWMSSVQLWNSDDHKTTDSKRENQKQMNSLPQFIKGAGEECDFVGDDPFQSAKKGNGLRAFMPFKGCSVFPAMPGKKEEDKEEEFPIPGLSLLTPGIKNPRGEVSCSSSIRPKTSANRGGSSSTPNAHSGLRAGPQLPHQQTPRKQRRCWSPELHRRFVNALQQLGGSQVATPKQIRELMQVDGLTNDEVKSHLQKYRLHTRRLPTAASTPAANQSVAILGGLWMPHDQYGESSKQSSSQSGSPQGPLQLAGAGGGTSTTGGDSMEEEEEEEKSESYGWRSHIQKPGKDDV